METLKSLFSFRGEIGRGVFLGTLIALSMIVTVLDFVLFVMGAHTGETIFDPMNRPLRPQSPVATVLFAIYWAFEIAFIWVTVAALAKRLRDVGIALKWLAVFVPVFVLFAAAISIFAPEGTTHVPPLGLAVIVVTGIPASVLGFWLLGSAIFAPGGKPRSFDPAQLPEGWKK